MLFTIRGEPLRDDRYHMISLIYLVELSDKNSTPVAQDDAASADWYDLRSVMKTPDIFAFDHFDILKELIETKEQYSGLR